ncbi:hypothetical protein BD309DRAFT_968576 [Dichomitus squalens]|uniref:Uncharacterized protein n=1 Tax=Dichomitus squalens TaxID=114155 RepID=A0A4Q9NFQ7_9APHY|nr:hypothetical protein BD311DRAFT_765484 [Dichomitus squalens]TBU39919.1 hypothetical protein BD309DRAFT_968576 [Dichomitus squalens]TBU55639.1 hypothetical protein BD310DRAFT_933254 [Dichomitus squalens]
MCKEAAPRTPSGRCPQKLFLRSSFRRDAGIPVTVVHLVSAPCITSVAQSYLPSSTTRGHHWNVQSLSGRRQPL